MKELVLAGAADALGDSLIATVADWGDKGLKAALIIIVLITVARRVSLKAGIGALLAMVIALSIYDSRNALSDKVQDEVNNPGNVAVQPEKPGQ
ncbi:hypothetical protein GCM10010329_82890 [Streptomyces spiroverticillatus]|uniref:Uncharacterized protein n=1 Tax=Streptomyces finlayi TaxID=67296 RepID=A0A918X8T5_9ACTN|nr:hypothetical protein [Streptomyces finlayi]GHA47887.1 hypothetical protein GCM10010329_82890 [Streptomyces spiroverticillatus]GHD18794.1 hypothetical protein GCM10010334_81950 [Streptomyces finlayi]